MPTAIKLAAAVFALLAGFYASDIIKEIKHASSSRPLEQHCLLSSIECTQSNVAMIMDKDTAQPLVPTVLTVNWVSSDAQSLVLDLKGLEMEMGSPKFVLTSVGNNRYQGEIMLPVCTMDSMTWLGKLSDGTTTVYPAIRMAR